MEKSRPNWQSAVLALLLALVLPPFLVWLRISLYPGSTMIVMSPVILTALAVPLIAGVLAARKTRRMPLFTGLAWLVWLLLPQGGAHMTAVTSGILGTAVLWGFASIPAAARFFTGLGQSKKAAA